MVGAETLGGERNRGNGWKSKKMLMSVIELCSCGLAVRRRMNDTALHYSGEDMQNTREEKASEFGLDISGSRTDDRRSAWNICQKS
jgi:hypothetical protein